MLYASPHPFAASADEQEEAPKETCARSQTGVKPTLLCHGLAAQPELPEDWRKPALQGGFPPTALHLESDRERTVWFDGYAVNRTKRLIKSSKVYWSNADIALHLTHEEEPRGAHLENLVFNDLLTWRNTRLDRAEVFY